jgi:hypothetical protein
VEIDAQSEKAFISKKGSISVLFNRKDGKVRALRLHQEDGRTVSAEKID